MVAVCNGQMNLRLIILFGEWREVDLRGKYKNCGDKDIDSHSECSLNIITHSGNKSTNLFFFGCSNL